MSRKRNNYISKSEQSAVAKVLSNAYPEAVTESPTVNNKPPMIENGMAEAVGMTNQFGFSPFAGGNQFPGGFSGTQVEDSTTMFENLRWYLVSNFRQLLSQAFVEIGLIQTIVCVPIDDGLRGGILIKSKQLDEEEIKELSLSVDRDDDLGTAGWAAKWERLYGGAGILTLVGDQDPEEPLDLKSINKDTDLTFRDVDMWELFWDKQNTEGYDPEIQSEEFEFYNYYAENVHRTRVMRLVGFKAPSFIRPRLRGWGVSVVEALVRSINQYLKATDLGFEVLDEFKLDVYKIKNLVNTLLSPNGTNKVKQTVQTMNWQKNYQNAIVMDSEDDFDHKQLSFAGLAEAMSGIRMQVAADMRMPISKLFGQSVVGGLGQSDGNDIENYNSMIESEVRGKLKFHIVRMLEIKCQKLFGFIPNDLEIEFKPLRELPPTDQETVKTAKFGRALAAKTAGLITDLEWRDMCNKGNLFDIQLDTDSASLNDPELGDPDAAEADGEEDGGEADDSKGANQEYSRSANVEKQHDDKAKQKTKNAKWEEERHPRADDGKFGSSPGGADGQAKVEQVKLKDIVSELKNLHAPEGRMKNWIENPDSTTAPEEISIVRKDGKIAGWSGVGRIRVGREWEAQLSVFVDESARGQGIGKELVKKAVDKFGKDDVIYFDPAAPHVGEWIEEAGGDPEPVDEDDLVSNSKIYVKTKNDILPDIMLYNGLEKTFRILNSPEFDKASYLSDGGDRWIADERRALFEDPSGVDKGLWQKAEAASDASMGARNWKFIVWYYKKMGGKFL